MSVRKFLDNKKAHEVTLDLFILPVLNPLLFNSPCHRLVSPNGQCPLPLAAVTVQRGSVVGLRECLRPRGLLADYQRFPPAGRRQGSLVRCCIQENRTPVILTKLKKHAKLLYDALSEEADRVFLLYGDNTQTQNQEIRRAMLDTPREKTMIVVATGQKIGEGFDCPRLDTLMLASPVKFDGRLIQYVGRLNRTYEGKTNVIVYDYVDAHIPIFDNQYRNRLAAYKRIGYRIQSGDTAEKQTVNSIFDGGNYTEVFEQDLVEAEREIVVASPGLRWRKVERMLSLLATRQEAGVKVTVVTQNPDSALFDNSDELWMLIRRMRESGVEVVLTESENEHYAVMDGKLVWHGGMNLLGREDAWDNLIRVESIQAATELLEMTEEAKSLRTTIL